MKIAQGTWQECEAAIAGVVSGDNGRTVTDVTATPGPNLMPKIRIATGNARPLGAKR